MNDKSLDEFLNPRISGEKGGTDLRALTHLDDTSEDKHMTKLTRRLNEDSDNIDVTSSSSSEKPQPKKKARTTEYPKYVTDGALLLLIYVILSQEFIQKLIGKYIPFLNPENGISNVSIVLYGIILTGSYISLKNLLLA